MSRIYRCMYLMASILFAPAAMSAALAVPNQLQRVMSANELRVCIWPDYYGITYRNPRTRQLSGIDIDIAGELGKELGIRVRYVDSSFSLLIDNLLGNQCDVAMHAVGITPLRSASLIFTQPYLRSDIYAVTTLSGTTIMHWDDIDKPGRVIAVQAGTIMEPVMKNFLKNATLLLVKPPMSRETEVESGRADAFMTDYPYSKRMRDMTSWARVIAPAQPFHLTDYAFALAPGDDSLRERIDDLMSRMKTDQRLQKFAEKNGLEPILIRGPDLRKAAPLK